LIIGLFMKTKIYFSFKNVFVLLGLSFVYLIPRIVRLGFDIINIDYPLWDNRATNFFIYLKTFNFIETYRASHPGVSLMWVGGGAIEIFSRLYEHFFQALPVINEYIIFPWRSLFIKLALVFSILFVYLLAAFLISRIFNKKSAVLFFIFLSLEPYVLAHDRIFHLEGLLTAFIFVSGLFSMYFWKKKELKYLVFAAIFASFSFLTKTTGIFAFLFFFLCAVVMFNHEKKILFRKTLAVFLGFVFLFCFFVFMFFPAMWVSPLDILSRMFLGNLSLLETGHSQYFLGNWSDNPGLLFYPLVFLFKSSPILTFWVFGFLAYVLWKLGVVKRTHKFSRKNLKEKVLIILFVLFYVVEISLSPKKVPRYILPIYPPLLLLMSISFVEIYEKCKNLKKYIVIFMFLAVLSLVLTVHKTFPDFLAYTNPVLGGMKKADYYIGNKHFGFGLREVADYMNKKPYANEIKLIFDGDGSIGPFFLGMSRNSTYIYRDHISTADYFLLPYYLLDTDAMYLEYKKDFVLEKVFNVNSYPYWYLFRNVRIE